jgi:transcription elongation factor Elf1
MKEIDHTYTDEVVCPYCGHEMEGDCGDGPTKGQTECQKCEKKFDCEPDYSVHYTTSKVPCWNGEPHNWIINRSFDLQDKKTLRNCPQCDKYEWIDVIQENKEII